MNKLKKVIIALLIFIILIIIVLLCILQSGDSDVLEEDLVEYDPPYEGEIEPAKLVENLELINMNASYFNAKDCIDRFYMSINSIADTYNKAEYYGYTDEDINNIQSEEFNKIYSMFDSEYLNQFNIDLDKVVKMYNKKESLEFYIDKIYFMDLNENIKVFVVHGRELNNSTLEIAEKAYIIRIDSSNLAFSLYPYEYLTKNNYLTLKAGDKITLSGENIEKKEYNIYNYQVPTNKDIVENLFNLYKFNLIYDKNYLYDTLDEEYRKNKFKDSSEFLDYINFNNKKLVKSYATQYQVNTYDDYTQYVCIDQNGKYYIFNETSVGNYTVMLDTYTVDVPQFVEKYNGSTEQEKVALNINRFIQAINDKSYYYAYNLLADSFKENNYKTQEEFENYIENNFFEENEIEFSEFSIEGKYYIYEIKIKDAINEQSASKLFTIIMALGEGTDFEMSFSI